MTKLDLKAFLAGRPDLPSQDDMMNQLPKTMKEAEAVIVQRKIQAEASRPEVTETETGFRRPAHYIHPSIAPRHLNWLVIPGKRLVSYSLLKPDFDFLATFNTIPLEDQDCLEAYEREGLPLKSTDLNIVLDAWISIASKDNGLDEAEARGIVRDTLQLAHLSTPTVQAIYAHWCSMKNMRGKPLMRHLAGHNNDTGPFGVFRPRQKEKMNLRRQRRQHKDTSHKMMHVEQDLSKVQHVLDVMRRRDTLRLQHFRTKCIIFDQKRHQLVDRAYRSPLWPVAARLKQPRVSGALRRVVSGTAAPCVATSTAIAAENEDLRTAQLREGRFNTLFLDRSMPLVTEFVPSQSAGWLAPPDHTAAIPSDAPDLLYQESLLEASRDRQGLALGANGIPGTGLLSSGDAKLDLEPPCAYPQSVLVPPL